MIDRRIEFDDIKLQAILGTNFIAEGLFEIPKGAVNALSFNTGIGVRRE